MHEQIEVVYENGVLRPLAPLTALHEQQHLTVTIDAPNGNASDTNPCRKLLEASRRHTEEQAKKYGLLEDSAAYIRQERDKRG